MKALYDLPVTIKEPVHKALEPVIIKSGVAVAMQEYKRMKADTAHYYIDWLAMTQLGEQLFNMQRYEDARVVYENNAQEFPERDYIMTNLAKTYEVLGRQKDAITWYKKAIEINPKNEEAKNRLKALDKQ